MKIFAKRENPLVPVLLEYEKFIGSLKLEIADLRETHLKLLQEYRGYREEMDKKIMALTRPDAVASLRGPRPPAPQNTSNPKWNGDLPVTKERLEELFNAR